MKALLRGIIDFQDGKISVDSLSANYLRLQEGGIDWSQPADGRIFAFVSEFFQANQDLPTAQTVKDFFHRGNDLEVQERLGDLESAPVYTHKNYAFHLQTLLEDQNRIKARALIKDTEEILTQGKVVKEGREQTRLKGIADAFQFFNEYVASLLPRDYNAQTEGDLRDGTEAAWIEYQEAETNKESAWGALTGIDHIDKVCKGNKPGELWVHAGYASELKTTIATNWAYNLVTRYRRNVLYVSLEMPFKQIRRLIYAIHSAHAKFREAGYDPLDYRKIRDGDLVESEKAFYKKVLEDFKGNPEYCRFETWCPDRDVTIQDIRTKAEVLHRQMDIGMIIIDHGGLVTPSEQSRDYVIALNSVIRSAKKLALHFNGGKGIPVLCLFQINREGKEYADKNEGHYKMRALSYANECLIGETIVKTNRGYCCLEGVTPGMKVWSHTGWKNVLNNFDQGERPVVEVCLDTGLRVRPTLEHRFLCVDECSLKLVPVSELQIGDWLVGDLGSRPFVPEPINLDKAPEFKFGSKTIRPSPYESAYLLGAHKFHPIDRAFGAWPNVEVTEAETVRILGRHGIPSMFTLPRDLEANVPEWVLYGSRKIVQAYLRGLWDCSGTVTKSPDHYRQDDMINCYLSRNSRRINPHTLEQVQLLMTDLGIETKITDSLMLPLALWVFGGWENMTKFYTLVGFTDSRRMNLLVTYLRKKRSIALRWIKATIPKDLVAGVADKPIGIHRFLRSRTQAYRDQVVQFSKENTHLGLHQVTEINPAGVARVYDLELDGDHLYSTGGLISHNCERSADYVTTSYLNDALREGGVTVICNLKNRDNPLFETFQASVDFDSRRVFNFDPTVSTVAGLKADTEEGHEELLRAMEAI